MVIYYPKHIIDNIYIYIPFLIKILMEKKLVQAHPSLVIAYCSKLGKVLTAVYSSSYRRGKGPYPLSANLIGGNPDINNREKAPIDVLIREISEEYNPDFQKNNPDTNEFGERVAWATPEDILAVRDSLLKNLEYYQDFYAEAEHFMEGTASYKGLGSCWYSEIPQEVIELVEANLRRQKTLTPEGLTGVFTLDELVNDPRGKLSTAHFTAPVLNYRFGINIPYPKEHFRAYAIGEPWGSYRDYLCDFEYDKTKRQNPNDPTKMEPSFYETVFGEINEL